MTTNLFVNDNVKQLRTGGSFRVLLPFFRTSWGAGVLNSANFNSFHNRVEFGTILEGLRNLPPLGTPLVSTIYLFIHKATCFDLSVSHLQAYIAD
jgi:hypothetical protein